MITVELIHFRYSRVEIHPKEETRKVSNSLANPAFSSSYLKSGLIEPSPSFNDDTKWDECCINKPSAWLNELLLIFGAEPALPLIKLSFCINKFGWDEGLKLFDGIFTGFVL